MQVGEKHNDGKFHGQTRPFYFPSSYVVPSHPPGHPPLSWGSSLNYQGKLVPEVPPLQSMSLQGQDQQCLVGTAGTVCFEHQEKNK